MDRGEFSACGSPTGLDSRDPFDLGVFINNVLYIKFLFISSFSPSLKEELVICMYEI